MRIGLDCDGVIYQWDRTARYMLREVLPDSPYKKDWSLKRDSSTWDYIQDTVRPEHWDWLWTEGVRLGLFRHGHLYRGSIQAIRELAEGGNEVVLITHRPKQAVHDTLSWMAYLDVPLAGVHILTKMESKALVRPACDVYLDDKPQNCTELTSVPGARVFMQNRPWNTSVMCTPGVVRTYDWDDFLNHVEGLQ